MWINCSMRSMRRRLRPRAAAMVLAMAGAVLACGPRAAHAQQLVFDPKNHLENALQAARQLESLANEAHMLTNQARELASSPYSHLTATSQTLSSIGELAGAAKGLASDVAGLQADFEEIYPAIVQGLDPQTALKLRQERNATARNTARDLASAAAELEQMAKARPGRLQGALAASQSAIGQTAAIQSSAQVLAVLAEDLASMRTLLGAQSRLMAQEVAERSVERAAAAEARRRFWANDGATPPNPNFNPLPHAKEW